MKSHAYHLLTAQLVQGPRMKSEATYDLEQIVSLFLDPHEKDLICRYNFHDELEVKTPTYIYNLTKIIEHCDFQQLQLKKSELNWYTYFLMTAHHQPYIEDEVDFLAFPSFEDFEKRDKDNLYTNLSYAEKLAINIYTTDAYEVINCFLRTAGRKTPPNLIDDDLLKQHTKEMVLTICIACFGLEKIQYGIENEELDGVKHKKQLTKSMRYENKNEMKHIILERIARIKKKCKEKPEKAFISTTTSHEINFKAYDTRITITQPRSLRPLGKRIDSLSSLEREKEILFPPGTQCLYYKYKKKSDSHYHFKMIPVRTIEGTTPGAYLSEHQLIRGRFIELRQEFVEVTSKYNVTSMTLFKDSTTSNIIKIIKLMDDLITTFDASPKNNTHKKFKKLNYLCKIIGSMIQKNKKNFTSLVLEIKFYELNIVQQYLKKILVYAQYVTSLLIFFDHKKVNPATIFLDLQQVNYKLDKKKLANERKDILLKLQIIKNICSEEYSDKIFYGNAALNRKILLDGDIADHLSPEVILFILSDHVKLKEFGQLHALEKYDHIAIPRGVTYISLVDAIYYALQDGLETIKLMPNNEARYNAHTYQEQKNNFNLHTKKIVSNILMAAIQSGLDINDKKYHYYAGSEELNSLSMKFDLIVKTILLIKDNHLSDDLLRVAGYETEEIREQCMQGFKEFCPCFYNTDDDAYCIDKKYIRNIQQIVDRFVSNENIVLNGLISHVFYDRVHLEAAIEQDTIIQLGSDTYTLRDILRLMILACEQSNSYSVATEQFHLRLQLVIAHLKEHFPLYWKAAHEVAPEYSLPERSSLRMK